MTFVLRSFCFIVLDIACCNTCLDGHMLIMLGLKCKKRIHIKNVTAGRHSIAKKE